jgi:hypothetical protein
MVFATVILLSKPAVRTKYPVETSRHPQKSQKGTDESGDLYQATAEIFFGICSPGALTVFLSLM